jgi:hypothetical protein
MGPVRRDLVVYFDIIMKAVLASEKVSAFKIPAF